MTDRAALAAAFIQQAPPGQVNDVINDIRTIIGSDDALIPYVLPTLRDYNLDHFHTVQHADTTSLLSHAALLNAPSERYVDPRSNQSFAFDHIALRASDYQPYHLPDQFESFRASLDKSLQAYTKDHFPTAVAAVFCSAEPVDAGERRERRGIEADAAAGAPVGDAPVDDAPVGDASVGNAPVGNAPVGDAPVGEAPVDSAVGAPDLTVRDAVGAPDDAVDPAVGAAGAPDAPGAPDSVGAPGGDAPGDAVDSAADAPGNAVDAVDAADSAVGDTAGASDAPHAPGAPDADADADAPHARADNTISGTSSHSPKLAPDATPEPDNAADHSAADHSAAVADDTKHDTEPTAAPVYTIQIVGNRYNPQNFWTGRWRSQWIVDQAAAVVSGSIKVDVHYYEQGNVQLSSSHAASFPLHRDASEIITAIAKLEAAYQLGLNDTYNALGDKAFKSLRRALPVTRQKVEWDKISGYRLGTDLKAA